MQRKRVWLIASVLALLVAACGGGGGADAESGGAAATSLTVVGNEFSFDPANATIAGGTDVSVTFENQGTIEHSWAVLKAGTKIDSEDQFTPDMVEFELIAAGGETVSGTVNLAPGEYEVICAIPGHFSAGMVGTLTVSG